jgi:hypothetical protein
VYRIAQCSSACYYQLVTGFLQMPASGNAVLVYLIFKHDNYTSVRLLLKRIVEMANEQTLHPSLAQIMLSVELDKLPSKPL